MQLVRHPAPRSPRSIQQSVPAVVGWFRARPAFVVVVALSLVFLLAPWPFVTKVHALLHGLCAQRFSHSYLLGGTALPFDARMTGIYGGFIVTFGYLLVMGRARAWGEFTRPVLALLGLFVVAMGIDGTNSTLRDFGLWYPYEPHNLLRLVTGMLTGISLATLLCYLVATTLWRKGDWGQATVGSVREVGLLVLLQVPFTLAVLSGMGVMYTPVSTLLVVSAISVFVAMALSALTILRKRDNAYVTTAQLQQPAAVALIVALAAIGSLATGRFLLEWWLEIPPML